MLLVIDNYDSFVHNLARYFRCLGMTTHTLRSDMCQLRDIDHLQPQAILISPGPKSPAEAGNSVAIIKHFSGQIPILGVCLGHQAIAAAFGGRVVVHEPMHGRQSQIVHHSHPLFEHVPSPCRVARYHSLIVERQALPDCLEVTASLGDSVDQGSIMAIAHREHPTLGVQFHPESILT
jgi:anthranilate synthase/aminodeoxychorismate synthase-like glutamine amidotransferase